MNSQYPAPPPMPAAPQAPAPYGAGAPPPPAPAAESDKSFVATWLLAWLLGNLGADRFYLGKIGTAIVKLITFGGFGIWTLIDLIMVLAGATKDKHGRLLAGYTQHRKIAWIVTAALVALSLIIAAISGAAGGAASNRADTSPAVDDAPVEEVAAEAPVEGGADEAAPEPEAPAEPGVADWATDQYGTFDRVAFSGSSADVITLPSGVAGGLVIVTHEGDGHFAITGLDASNQSTAELLVNTVGGYAGTTAWGISALGDAVSLQVTASGSWSVELAPMSSATILDTSSEGSGDQVLLYGGDAGTMAISNDGAGHFAVQQDTNSPFEFGLLVNEIGPYSGNVAVSAGPSLITVTSDGTWSLAIG